MDNKYLVRIIKSELFNFKNVQYGEVRYMNYRSVEKKAELEKHDILGIYGQNGSGKTALVEALDILKCILAGEEIPYEVYEGLIDPLNNTRLSTVFYLEYRGEKYKVCYEVAINADSLEKRIKLIEEKLTYWKRGVTWKSERDLKFSNPFYDSNSILEELSVEFQTDHQKAFESVPLAKGLQNLAVYCAQRNRSIFFNDLFMGKLAEYGEGEEEKRALAVVLNGLSHFGKLYFQVVKVNQLADINRNAIIPVNIHAEEDSFVMQGCLPLVMNGKGKIPESLYVQLKNAVRAINIALKAIIPNLSIELRKMQEEPDENGKNQILVEVYSRREDKEFLTRYESEGIKRIISLLNYLIALYNYPQICLVVDELDSGIFEYLLGEILGVLNEEAKGQLIFTSHNLRAFEKLHIRNIICTTINPKNRYIRLQGKEKNHNPRDFYLRTITVGGQKEELYDEADLQTIGYAFRKACKPENQVNLNFSENFRKKLQSES